MAIIRNSEIQRELIETANIQISSDEVPGELASKVVPTMEVNPKLVKGLNYVAEFISLANSNTVVVSPAKKDLYITNIDVSYEKDVVCDMATGTALLVKLIQEQQPKNLAIIGGISLTKESKTMNILLKTPFKVDRGSDMTLSRGGAYTAGVFIRTCTLTGFTIEE